MPLPGGMRGPKTLPNPWPFRGLSVGIAAISSQVVHGRRRVPPEVTTRMVGHCAPPPSIVPPPARMLRARLRSYAPSVLISAMPDALALLTTRRSVKPIELVGPAPSAAEIDTILTIAA